MTPEQEAAFGQFVAARSRHLLRLAHLLTGDPQRAAALLEDALARLYLRWDRLQGDNPEGLVRRHLATGTTRRSRPALPVEPAAGTAADVRDAVLHALAGLPRRQRAAVVLHHVEDLTDPEIAQVLGCSTGAVTTLIARATQRLHDDPGLRAELA